MKIVFVLLDMDNEQFTIFNRKFAATEKAIVRVRCGMMVSIQNNRRSSADVHCWRVLEKAELPCLVWNYIK